MASLMNIESFKHYVKNIQRATLFEVFVTGPVVGNFDTEVFRFTCKSAQMPASIIGVIEVPYMGRKIKFAGDRTYEEWNTTVIVNDGWNAYKNIYNWHMLINDAKENTAKTDDMNQLKGTAIVRALRTTGVPNFAMRLVGFFPSNLQSLELGWEQNDTTADLQASWAFDYALMVDANTIR